MAIHSAFELIDERFVKEINSNARLFEHKKTGARFLSVINSDENKVFSIAFRTPPTDSTGVAHILEHSVLCGSKKYPLKEPFVELLKGSLQTFLNAFTYPDKTCYPVASQNTQDLYNLMDVYLDAVFYPCISKDIFAQEGWHLELGKIDAQLSRKGVVYNEMKGAYSSPDSQLAEYSQQILFPDTTYGLDSGGKPSEIPNLSYEQFKEFHSQYYHPSNSWIYMYGDDEEERRLEFLDSWLQEFSRIEVHSEVGIQEQKEIAAEFRRSYAVGAESENPKSMLTVNWLLPATTDIQTNFALAILEHILIGTAGSPLRKALFDLGFGEDLAGVGMERELRQMYFSVGLKGIQIGKEDAVRDCIFSTLEDLVRNGIAVGAVEAGINSVEFSLRENNTGSFPRGLAIFLRSMTTWLYDASPFLMLEFESVLAEIKQKAAVGGFFEEIIKKMLLDNQHRSVLVLEPDCELSAKIEAEEQEKLEQIRSQFSSEELQYIVDETIRLQAIQEKPDSAEALATIPVLQRNDMPKENKKLPGIFMDNSQRIFTHELDTNGILYLDLGFDLRVLPDELVPYAGLLGQAMLEMGTKTEDYVLFTQQIDRKTGGIYSFPVFFQYRQEDKVGGRLFFRSKVVSENLFDLFELLQKIVFESRLDDIERFIQIVLEAKSGMEQRIIPGGHQLVAGVLRAGMNRADAVQERIGGVEGLFFLRRLADELKSAPQLVLERLQQTRELLISRDGVIFNLTGDDDLIRKSVVCVEEFLQKLPEKKQAIVPWQWKKNMENQGFGIPAMVNYVGMGCNLFESGSCYHGSAMAVLKYLRTTWLWEKVRVLGGAYGAFCSYGRNSGLFTFGSYRDPNLTETLQNFRASAEFLQKKKLTNEEVDKSVIGAIGDLDAYMLPDAKGFSSLMRFLSGISEQELQNMRDELLATTATDFQKLGAELEKGLKQSKIVVAGSEDVLKKAKNVSFQKIISLL